MNIEWMRCFIEVARRKSISKASESLNLTQPAVSQQIKKIEDYFGVTLFNRSAFGMELTEAGRLLNDKLGRILRDIDDLSLELISFKTPNKIAIGTIPSLAMYFLPKKLLMLQKEGIEVDIQVRNTSAEVFELLASETVQAALLETNQPHVPYWRLPIFQEQYVAVLPLSHPLSGSSHLTMQDIKNEPLIVYPAVCDVRRAITQEYENNHLKPNISAEVAFGESIIGFVLAETGVTIVPVIMTKHIGHLPLAIIPIVDFKGKRVIELVSRSKPAGEWLSKYLK